MVLQFFMSGGYALSFPYLAIYLRKERHIPFWIVGIFLTASLFLAAAGRLLGGSFSDKFGRRPLLSWGIVTRTLCVFSIGLAIAFKAAFPIIVSIDFIGALAAGSFNSTLLAWVSDHFEEHLRVKAYSAMRTTANLGWAVGPAIAGLAVGKGYALLFLGTAAVYFLCALGVLFFLRESHPLILKGEKVYHKVFASTLSILRHEKFYYFFLGTFLIGAVMGHIVVPLSLYASETLGISPKGIGLLFSLNGGMVVIFQVWLIHALRCYRLPRILGWGALVYAAGYASLAWAFGFKSLEIAVAIITLGEMAIAPSLSALASNLSSPQERGRALGAMGFFHQVGYALSPLIGGLGLQFFSTWHPCPYWFFVGGLAVLAAWAFFKIKESETTAPFHS